MDKYKKKIGSMKGTISYLEWQNEASQPGKKKGQTLDPTTVAKTYHSVKKLVVEPAKVFSAKLAREVKDLIDHNKHMVSQFHRIHEIKSRSSRIPATIPLPSELTGRIIKLCSKLGWRNQHTVTTCRCQLTQ